MVLKTSFDDIKTFNAKYKDGSQINRVILSTQAVSLCKKDGIHVEGRVPFDRFNQAKILPHSAPFGQALGVLQVDCTMYHIAFTSEKPWLAKAIKDSCTNQPQTQTM